MFCLLVVLVRLSVAMQVLTGNYKAVTKMNGDIKPRSLTHSLSLGLISFDVDTKSVSLFTVTVG